MQLQNPFDARQVEPAGFAPPLPLADYHVRISDSEAKPTGAGDGGYLELLLEVLDPGPYAGRKVPYILNLFNKSQTTVEIAYRQLSAVCHVIGVFNVQDTRQLHNIPFIANMGPQTKDPRYTQVFVVKDINGVVPGQKGGAGAPPPVAAQPAALPPAAPPWGAPPPAAPVPPANAAPWGPPPPAAPPAAPWGQPPAQAPATAAPAPPWAPPGAAAPPAPPAWGPPPSAAPPASAAPPWQPGGAPSPAKPPWA